MINTKDEYLDEYFKVILWTIEYYKDGEFEHEVRVRGKDKLATIVGAFRQIAANTQQANIIVVNENGEVLAEMFFEEGIEILPEEEEKEE